ncbi:MAG: TRAP transporter small permease [Candidatus Methylomirabilales bacterium]
MERLRAWCSRLEHVLIGVIAILVGCILVSVTVQVVSRIVGIALFVWLDEVIRVSVLWLTFLGSAVAIRRKSHFVIDLLVEMLPLNLRRIAHVGIQGGVLIGVLLLLWTGWQLSEIAMGRVYPITRVRQTWGFAAVPVGGTLMLLFLIEGWLYPAPQEDSQTGAQTT